MTAPKACVIGWPVAHSRSPLIHGYWLARYGLAGAYERAAVPPDGFAAFVAAMRGGGYVGGNVTIPHKAEAAATCQQLTPAAARLGSVNTLWFEGETLCGDTTDGEGFLAALDDAVPNWLATTTSALILGAGGAAAPIVDALMQRGVGRIIVANRTRAKAQTLAGTLGCETAPLETAQELLATTDLLVNTTAAGMAGQAPLTLDLAGLPAHAIVDDIVYAPAVTPLLRDAAARGLATVGGLGMLLHQAAPGFARWFGRTPAITDELRALLAADVGCSQT